MPFDVKKEYKEFYLPPRKPTIVTVPPMNFLAVHGQGDPNTEGGEYKQSIELLYGVAYTIKMSKKGSHQIKGYYDGDNADNEYFKQIAAQLVGLRLPGITGLGREEIKKAGEGGSCSQEESRLFQGPFFDL